MVTNQVSFNTGESWEDLPTVRKGKIGEYLVRDFLESRGFITYSPDNSAPHPFDKVVVSRDGRRLLIAEVKTKNKRIYYPDTGIDIRLYNKYKAIQKRHSLDVYIFFVDAGARMIYGNLLKNLEGPFTMEHKGKLLEYPLTQGSIIYFPLVNMENIAEIPVSDLISLQSIKTK